VNARCSLDARRDCASKELAMFNRLALAAVRHRYWILACWLVAVLAALPFAPRASEVLAPGGFSSPDMESQRAVDALQSGLHTSFTSVLVLFSSPTLSADDPPFQAEASAAVAHLAGWSEIERVVPYQYNPMQVSRDRHAAYTAVFLRSDPDSAPKVLPALRARLAQPHDLTMTVGGGPVFYADIQSVSEADLRRAEMLAFPFALIALVLVFRSVVAAGLPAAVGGCSVVVSLALLFLVGSVVRVSVFALNITTLFGLGLGVDYSLFMVSRFREELARGHAVPEAVAATMHTAGRAVFFSGLAVSIGLAGLLLFPLNMLRSVGLGGMLTVVMAILAAVTLLPALLAVLGERVNALPVRLPAIVIPRRGSRADGRGKQTGEASLAPASPYGSVAGGNVAGQGAGFWHRLALGVMRHPIATLVPVLALLLLLGLPYLSVRLAAPDASILPASVKSRAAYDLLVSRFEVAQTTPIVIAVRTPGSPLAQTNLEALDRYVRSLAADPRVASVQSIVSLDPRLTLAQYELLYSNPGNIADPYIAQSLSSLVGERITMVEVISKYGMLDPRSEALVEAIRNTPPQGGFSALVDGGTAGIVDYVNTLYGALPVAMLVIFAVTYVVLLLLFRSLVLPLKAILMNLLSIVACYGALVFIFQEGHLSALLHFTPLGFVEATGPILIFCTLFGLSMDYEVFLLSRIREAYEQSGDNTASVAMGMERSGRIITSAAAIVIVVSAAFSSADLIIIKALAVGMALAVLLDATLVRGLLVPATMRLLGDLNWYWPAWLDRLLPARLFAHASANATRAVQPEGVSEPRPLRIGGEE
jgi:RND superfamily putative drug exporter